MKIYKMKKQAYSKIGLAIGTLLLVPVVVYTVFQFVQRSKEEELIRSIYNEQLETLLFSVNQHCWDAIQAISSELLSLIPPEKYIPPQFETSLKKLLKKYPFLDGIFIGGMAPQPLVISSARATALSQTMQKDPHQICRILQKNQEELEKRIRRAAEGYLQPHPIAWSNSQTLLIFPMFSNPEKTQLRGLTGIFINDSLFVIEVVERKLKSMDTANLAFAIERRSDKKLFYTEENTPRPGFEKKEALWILPHLDVLIKLRGTTLNQLSKAKSQKNLILLLFVDGILIFGIYGFIRNVNREIALAQLKTDFVANVSHELRTPLSLIQLYAETLEMDRVKSEEKKHQYYRTIVAECKRLSKLVNNILDFSKMEQKKKKFQKIRISLVSIIESVLEMYRFHLCQMHFEVETCYDSSVPEVEADPEAISQALVNLLDNAIKFSPDQKWIRISLYQENQFVVLSVQDKGIGIPESEQKKIFEKFYRAGSSLVHNTKGSGLGLSLVKQIMLAHEGNVRVQSKPGKGSTFSMIFPISLGKEKYDAHFAH